MGRDPPVSGRTHRHRLALFGAGRWGRHYVRLLPALGADLVVCCTRRARDTRSWLAEQYPSVEHTTDRLTAFDSRIDAVVIATPRQTHAPLAMAALRRGLHVLVEKPVAPDVATLRLLHAEAGRRGAVLMTGYTHCFDSAFRTLCRIADGAEATDWSLEWHVPASITEAHEVIWEYFPHVFSMALMLAGGEGAHSAVLRTPTARRRKTDGVAVEVEICIGRTVGRVRVLTAAVHRRKRIVLRGGDGVLASWTDRRLYLVDTRTVVYADEEPLAVEIRSFLDALGPTDGVQDFAGRPSDLAVTALLNDLTVQLARDGSMENIIHPSASGSNRCDP